MGLTDTTVKSHMTYVARDMETVFSSAQKRHDFFVMVPLYQLLDAGCYVS